MTPVNTEVSVVRDLLKQVPLNLSPIEMRAVYDSLGTQFPTAADVQLRQDRVHGMKAEWSTAPGAREDRVILYLHGGGYTSGSNLSHRHLVTELGRAAQARTFAIEYRLAPENPFPAAIDDALAGYRHLLDIGFAPSSIAIAGDSAGGGLTVATLLAAREASLPQPACAVCISPWVDLAQQGATMGSKASRDPLVQREPLLIAAGAYLGDAGARDPRAAPLLADLHGLAALLIQVGSDEVLLDDSVRLAAAAGAQEVAVRLDVWPHMVHVWHFFHPLLGDGRRALNDAGAFIQDGMNSALAALHKDAEARPQPAERPTA